MDINELSSRDLALIYGSFLFKRLSREIVLSVCSDPQCGLVFYSRGEIIFSPEKYFRSCGLILSGAVKVSKPSPGGQELFMNTLKRGSLFGAAALWAEHEGYVTVLTAIEKCRVIYFPQELLERAMLQNPELALNYIRFLSGRVCFLNDKIQTLIAGSARDSLAQYLEDCFERYGEAFRLDLSLSALATVLNVGRASLYRSFKLLEDDGIISREGRGIRILDAEKLRRLTI